MPQSRHEYGKSCGSIMKDFEHAAAVVAAVAVFPASGAGAAPSSQGECRTGTTMRCSGAGGTLKIQMISKAKPAKD